VPPAPAGSASDPRPPVSAIAQLENGDCRRICVPSAAGARELQDDAKPLIASRKTLAGTAGTRMGKAL